MEGVIQFRIKFIAPFIKKTRKIFPVDAGFYDENSNI